MGWIKDWKLKLRYGKLQTPFRHYTLIADGEVLESNPDYETMAGMPTFFTLKAWATDDEEAVDMVRVIGRAVGFDASGEVQIYADTPPEVPPRDKPHGYGLAFHPYQASNQ